MENALPTRGVARQLVAVLASAVAVALVTLSIYALDSFAPVLSLGVLYATGNTDHLLATNAAGHACLKKPYRPSDVVRSLKIIERLIDGSLSTEGRPAGLFLLDQSTASGGA